MRQLFTFNYHILRTLHRKLDALSIPILNTLCPTAKIMAGFLAWNSALLVTFDCKI